MPKIHHYRLYNNKRWMERQFYDLRKTPKEIALAAACSEMTIYRKLKQLGMLR